MGICLGCARSAPSSTNNGPSSPGTFTSRTSSTTTMTTTATTTTTFSSDGKFSSSIGGSSVGQFSATSESADGGDSRMGRILEVPNLRIFTFAELKSATRNFKPETLLGEGGFGRVFKGWVDERTLNPAKSGSGMVVAVKKLNPESMQGLEEWQSEVNFLGSLSHVNLVRLLGYCWEDKDLLLVYEFMAKGSLENHLFKRGAEPLNWGVRIKILIGAARGLAFLHNSERKVIYRDFKSSNILLDSHYNAKISDFGLAKNGPLGADSHVTTRIMGTYGYAAPEYVATGHLYVKSDVYGFGVVLLEMLSGLRALDTNRPSGQHNLVEWMKPQLGDRRKLSQVMDQRLEAAYPRKAALQASRLALRCLASEPKGRPSMKEVAEALQQIDAMEGAAKGAAPSPRPAGRAAHRPGNVHPGPCGRPAQ